MKLSAKVLSSKEQVGKLRAYKEHGSAKLIAAGAHHDKLSDELTIMRHLGAPFVGGYGD